MSTLKAFADKPNSDFPFRAESEIATVTQFEMGKQIAAGFTLIELLVVIAIIAALVSIAYPVFNSVQERARAAQDMSNLRQIGLATQMYMNDNDGAIFDGNAGAWMSQLEPKYIPAWKVFQSPFDKRPPLEDPTNSPVSYGINGGAYGNVSGTSAGIEGLLSDKIQNPSAYILFAPAQTNGTSVTFSGTAGAAVGLRLPKVYNGGQSWPGGPAAGGTHSNRTRINAVFADCHTETLSWSTFISDNPDANAKCADGSSEVASPRWHPDPCHP